MGFLTNNPLLRLFIWSIFFYSFINNSSIKFFKDQVLGRVYTGHCHDTNCLSLLFMGPVRLLKSCKLNNQTPYLAIFSSAMCVSHFTFLCRKFLIKIIFM